MYTVDMGSSSFYSIISITSYRIIYSSISVYISAIPLAWPQQANTTFWLGL